MLVETDIVSGLGCSPHPLNITPANDTKKNAAAEIFIERIALQITFILILIFVRIGKC